MIIIIMIIIIIIITIIVITIMIIMDNFNLLYIIIPITLILGIIGKV